MDIWGVQIPLLPFIELRKEQEIRRAANARKHKRVKKIPTRYPSVNTMYPFSKRTGRKYLSPEGELYKDYIDEKLSEKIDFVPPWSRYEVSYVFYMTYEMMYTKKDELAEHDVSNFLKGTEDALFDWLLESDATVMSIHGHKRLTVNDPKIIILMSPSNDGAVIRHCGYVVDPYELEVDIEECVRFTV